MSLLQLTDEALLEISQEIKEATRDILKQQHKRELKFMGRRYLSIKETQEYLGVSFNKLTEMRKNGLPVIEDGGKKWIDKQDIDEYFRRKKII